MLQTYLKPIGSFVSARLKEPSTYVGLGLLAVTLGAPATEVNKFLQIGGLILGGSLVSVSEPATE